MYQSQRYNKTARDRGISLVEVVVAFFLISIVATVIISLAAISLQSTASSERATRAQALAAEALEAVRSIRDETVWDTDGLGTVLFATDYYTEFIGSPPQWSLEEGAETIGGFSRVITFEEVARDGDDNITEFGGSVDPHTLLVIVTVSWEERGGTRDIELVTYFTNWKQ